MAINQLYSLPHMIKTENPASAETMSLITSLTPVSKAGLADYRLVFHTYENHIEPSLSFLLRQLKKYRTLGVEINPKVAVATELIHDHGIAEPLDKDKHETKEQRTVEQVTPILPKHGLNAVEIEETRLGILATSLFTELDPDKPNTIVVVQADLHNTWDGYLTLGEELGYQQMATNAQRVRREDENLDEVHLTFTEHKDKVNFVLGTFFDRDMAISNEDRLPDTGECVYNHIGRLYLARYMTETPASLSPVVGIPELQLV